MTPAIGIRRLVVAAVAAATALSTVGLAPSATAAPSSDTGLYGAADPTYDGVYRQSLAVMGLAANDQAAPTSAITWLLGQQCADGSFQAYRADTTQACAKPDPVNFSGPDTNSTAVALMALMALDNDRVRIPAATVSRIVDAADKAGRWLRNQQNPDGGWPYFSGGTSDANSTGLALSAILTQAPSFRLPAYTKARLFLGRLSASCPDGGGFPYQAGGKVDGSATAQGLVGITGPLPVRGPRTLAAKAPCLNTAKARAASYLAGQLRANGHLMSPYGSGPDYTNTGWAVLGLVAARQGRTAVARATADLKSAAKAETRNADGPVPGDLGLFLLVAEATGSSPTNFGGVNLISALAGSIRR